MNQVDPSIAAAVAQAKQVDAFSRDVIYSARSIFEALLRDLANDFGYLDQDDFEGLAQEFAGRLTYASIFDFSFLSDERCDLELLLIDGKPVCTLFSEGDRSTYDDIDILCPDGAVELVSAFYRQRMRVKLDNLKRAQDESPSQDTMLDRVLTRSQYLVNVGNNTFCVGSPRGCEFSFAKFFKTHKAAYLGEDCKVVPIESFEGWVTAQANPYKDDPSDSMCKVQTKDGEVVIGAQRVIFTLNENFDPKHIAELEQFACKNDFFVITRVEQLSSDSKRKKRYAVEGLQHVKGNLGTCMLFYVIEIETDAETVHGIEVAKPYPGRLTPTHPLFSNYRVS